MTAIEVSPGGLGVRFTASEKLAGFVHDVHVPWDAVQSVEAVANGLAAARGVRAPGLGVPGRRKLGTWRRRTGSTLVSVRHDQPAVRLLLAGRRPGAMLIGTDDAAATVAAIARVRAAAPAAIDVRFSRGGQVLAGTLLVPRGAGPFPAALIISGSGPINRNSDHRRLPLGIARLLGETLAEAGVASLRYDKRGVGQSPGDWRQAGLVTNADDAAAALSFLAGRPEIDSAQVFVIGHSEGAVLATMLASRDSGVAGAVLLAGSAKAGEDVLRWQAHRILPTLPRPLRAALRMLRVDLTAKITKNHQKVKATSTDIARIGGVRVNARWLREYMAYDPRPDLARIGVPVLAITGSKDLQVDPADLAEIARLVPGAETRLAPDVTHTLRSQTAPPTLRAYRREVRYPLDPAVASWITAWLHRHTHPARCNATTSPTAGER